MGYSVRVSVEQRPINNIVLAAIIFEGSLLVLALGLAWLLGQSPAEQVEFRWQAVGFSAVATCPLLVALLWCTRSRWKVFTRLEIENQVIPLFADCSVLELAAISILAGLAEESLFRGVLQTALTDSLSPPIALLVASTLFGLVHFITPTYALLASVIGVYLGSLLMICDNLLVPILVHSIYDFGALVYLVRKYK